MAALIKGIPVTLYERTPAGLDAFGALLYEEAPVTVDNVLVCPVAQDDIVDGTGLDGRRAEYILRLPKGDAHTWEGCRVDFFNQSWRVFGPPLEYIDGLVPLDWNRSIRVERYE